ncbi:MAG: hypothetical protein HYZ27_03310 [Deltaproteobacteria bacterium]|nr:hypothetical protein [Deltaproteobacteria bacterium]
MVERLSRRLFLKISLLAGGVAAFVTGTGLLSAGCDADNNNKRCDQYGYGAYGYGFTYGDDCYGSFWGGS